MSTLKRRIWPLKFIGGHARTAVLGAALRAGSPDEAEGLARELLLVARRKPESMAVPHLVARWAWLSAPQRGEVALLVGKEWRELAAYLANDPEALTRANAAKACGEVGGLGVAAGPTIVALLADPDQTVAEEAENTLAVFMRGLAEHTLDDAGQAGARAAADAAIETFDKHRRTGALRIAIQHGLVTRGGATSAATGKWMNDADHPAHMVVRGLIRTSDDPAMRSCAWVWLKHPSLATACVQRLTRADSLADQSVVLERAHLALNPLREAGLNASKRVDERDFAGTLPRLSQIDGLSLHARHGLARWLNVAPVSDRLRDAASAVLLTAAEPSVRQSLAVTAAQAERSPSCLLDLMFDPDPAVATTAADAVLSRAGGDALPDDQRERLVVTLTRSPHQPLRHLAAQASQRPGGVARERAIAEALRLTESFAAGTGTVSPRAVASAVATLACAGGDDGPAIEPVLLKAADLPDARVRANAVEGLLRRVRTRRTAGAQPADESLIVGLLLDRATDAHHRIRANAARALLICGWVNGVRAEAAGSGAGEPRAAAEIEARSNLLVAAGSRTLGALLADARTMHRVAGFWLAHRLGDAVVNNASQSGSEEFGTQLLDRVSHAASRAIDPMERIWADRARARLETSLRERWSKRAPTLEEAAA